MFVFSCFVDFEAIRAICGWLVCVCVELGRPIALQQLVHKDSIFLS